MRLCFSTPNYPNFDTTAGVGVYTRTLAHALAARGHEIHVLLVQRRPPEDRQDGPVQVHIRWSHWLPVLSRWLPGSGQAFCLAWALWRLQRRYRFDAVELFNDEGNALIAVFLRLAPIVVRIHTTPTASLAPTATVGERFAIWTQKTTARLAKVVATPSNSESRLVRQDFGVREVQVIPHGIFLPDLKNSSGTGAVLFVGNIDARKRVATLLAAAPLVLREVPAAEFWLVGNDPGGEHERAFRAAHPEIPRDKVKFLGSLPPDKVAPLFASCAVYASASIYESFGLAIVEAMAYGKPVVACGVTAMLETVQNEQTGLLVPPDDHRAFAAAIVTLLRDKVLREQFGKQGRRVVEQRYTADRMAAAYEQFLDTTLIKPAPGRCPA